MFSIEIYNICSSNKKGLANNKNVEKIHYTDCSTLCLFNCHYPHKNNALFPTQTKYPQKEETESNLLTLL